MLLCYFQSCTQDLFSCVWCIFMIYFLFTSCSCNINSTVRKFRYDSYLDELLTISTQLFSLSRRNNSILFFQENWCFLRTFFEIAAKRSYSVLTFCNTQCTRYIPGNSKGNIWNYNFIDQIVFSIYNLEQHERWKLILV